MTSQTARVSSLWAPTRDAGASDAELLGRFIADRDGPAFTALVTRHGPMVFGVCRRIVRDWHVAEDAFQATFLVLARKARSVLPPDAVAAWLYGVAYRVAKDARRAELRRASRERPTADLPEPSAESTSTDTDLRRVLDDELWKLPGKYRDLLIACDLEERPRAPVAASLGIPEGTLSSRLTTARKMLAGRLAKRGVAPAVVAGIALRVSVYAAGEVSRSVLASTARLGYATNGAVPVGVAAFASGAIRAMTYKALAPVAFFLLTAFCAIGAALAADNPLTPPPAPVKPPVVVFAPRRAAPVPPKVEPKLLPKGPNKLFFARDGFVVVTDPDGKNQKQLIDGEKIIFLPNAVFVSPDGTRMCTIRRDNSEVATKSTVLVVRFDGKDTGTNHATEARIAWACWSADGSGLIVSETESLPSDNTFELIHHAIDLTTGKRTKLDLPADQLILDRAHNGSFLGTRHVSAKAERSAHFQLWLIGSDGKPKTEIKPTDKEHYADYGTFSPDGQRVLYPHRPNKARSSCELSVYDIASNKNSSVADVPLNAVIQSMCWSPDGKKIAYSWHLDVDRTKENAEQQETEFHVTVCDPDGKNQKTVASEKGKVGDGKIGRVDWR